MTTYFNREHGGWLVIPTTETVCKTDWKTKLARENSEIRVDEWPLSKQWCKSILGKLNFLVDMQSNRTDKKNIWKLALGLVQFLFT